MALTILNGKKVSSDTSSVTKNIMKTSLSLTERNIVVQPQSMHAFLHAEVVLCGLNISLSDEPINFSLFNDNDINASQDTTNQFAKLEDATDKFFGVDPSLETAERSEFYNEDDQLTEGQKRFVPKNRSKKQVSFLVANDVISNMTPHDRRNSVYKEPVINYYFDLNIKQKPQPI
ncbi:MAG: hypothetical protein CML45_05640 [Rhodobacteraceae bacterium]|nr:hypothetical protein [Paracoccaceae bacterium]|tara:strand:+ start:1439 stop:1963 length:525 start_codon:yes stop_codon:yes gene_type:complete